MNMTTVLIISLAAGVVLVVGGGLMMYMADLVKNAYELKVQINNEIDERLTKMAEDLDKKSRWIKRDLIEEIEKVKIAMETDNARKFGELTEPFAKRLDTMEENLRKDHADWVKGFEADREFMTKLDAKLGILRREIKQGAGGDAGAALDAAAAGLTGQGTAEAAAPGDPAAPPPAPAAPAAAPAAPAAKMPPGRTAGTTMSGFLPDLGRKS